MAEFNVQAYLDANPDLPDTWTDAEAIAHYITFGFDEGRDVYWSATDYITLNPDLAGMTEAEAFSHWVVFGKDEGRVPWFQADEYIEANGDLAGMDAAQALSHWVNFGRDEGRIKGFDADGYIELNADLPTTWTYAEALNHYYQFGEGEGRAFDPYEEGTIAPPPAGTIVPVVDDNVTTLPIDTEGGTVTLTANDITVDGGAGTQVLRLTGDASTRIDLTNPASQMEGLDLNGDGSIANNGVENNLSNAGIITVSNFEVVDAYARNPINELDHDNNYFGDIDFDGTGYNGDGVNTDGNIYLGGLGVDEAFGGIGNDFMAGGGVAADRFVFEANDLGILVLIDTVTGLPAAINTFDTLSGGRNADFFFVELSALDNTDGNGTDIDGGTTWDNDPTQNRDWVLLEASDDNEPVAVNLGVNIALPVLGQAALITNVDNLDASGDLYSFLDSFDAVIGGMRDYMDAHDADGTENSGLGSTGQLVVTGNALDNIAVGGYDNDNIGGGGGDDILFGGKLQYLLAYANNPNLIDANDGLDLNVTAVGTVNDGRDTLSGGAGDDTLVFEMDGGNYEGGAANGTTGAPALTADNDILHLTDFSMGRMQGHTAADELAQGDQAQADALAALTTDSTVRIDLGVGQGVMYRGYGGADTLNNEINAENFTADQTNYATDVARATVQDIDGVIATGLGDLDYDADGANVSDLSARYQANFAGIDADMDLRGVNVRDVAGNFGYLNTGALDTTHNAGDNTLYANTGNDKIEGRAGNDLLSGGQGHDDFIFNLNGGDDVDVIHRQDDEDVDGLWDGTFSQDYRVTGDGISADPSTVAYTVNNPDDIISVLFTLDGSPIQAAGAGITAATTMAEIATETNTQLQAIDANLTAAEDNGDLVITDASGRAFTATSIAGDLSAVDFIASAVIDNGTPSQSTDEIDRLIMKSYSSRATNLGTLDQEATLGANAYAQDLVVGFVDDGNGNVTTNLVNGQQWDIQFQELNEGDVVTVTINGVDYSRTVQVGETTDLFVANFVNQINTQTLDTSTTSGQIAAAQNDVFVAPANDIDESVLQITEVGGLVYMARPEVTVTNPNGTPGTAVVADVSASTIELFEYDGRNNELNEDTVLFVGNSGANDNYGRDATDPMDISAGSDYSWSVLATALTDGGTLTGSDAILVDLVGFDGVNDTALHGDDLLIGAAGDDVINAGTGDDEIIGSAGTDTIDGGGNEAVGITANGIVQNAAGAANYQDVLVFNEDNFAVGTTFDIAVGGIGFANDGTVTVGGAGSGETTYTGIELVRTYSNTADDTLDFSALSDEIAATTTAGATQAQRDMLFNEGVAFVMGGAAAGMTYDVDLNNDDDTLDAGEAGVPGSAVLGVENIIGGGANDTVTIEETQAGSTNTIDLAGNANDEGALTVGQDTVIYQHNNVPPGLTAAQRPDMTVAVSTTNTIVTLTKGVLQGNSTQDTLTNVEVVDVTAAALGANNADVLDVSAFASGALVNYGANRAMGDTLQPNGNALDNTSAQVADEALLVTGGVSAVGNGQGAETLIVNGITLMEQVTGSEGDDRVLIANNMQDANAGVGAAFDSDIGFDSYLGAGTGGAAVQAETAYNGLFQFNLGEGDSDSLDYRNEADDVAVVLASDDTGADRIILDAGNDGNLTNDVQVGNRIDLATGVERYFGGQATNRIDLSATTVATTIEFSAESQANANEYVDPDGHLATADTNILGIEVRDTATADVFGRFMDAPANAQGFNAATAWSTVRGNAQGQTVIFSDNETAAAHFLNLEGGANTVDYANLTTAVTLNAIQTVDFAAGPPEVNPELLSSFTANGDTVTFERAEASGFGTLTVVGSGEANDLIDLTGWVVLAANSYNFVDLAAGTITEDVLGDTGEGNFSASVSAFENVTGSAVADRIWGDGQDNGLTGGDGADILTGRGGADQIVLTDTDAAEDRVQYVAITDGEDRGEVAVADADALTGFTTTEDKIVITEALQSALSAEGIGDENVAGAIDLTTEGVWEVATVSAANIDGSTNAQIIAAITGGGGVTFDAAATDEALFLVTGLGGEVGLYHYADDGGSGGTAVPGDADNDTIDAQELTLLAATTDGLLPVADDFVIRVVTTNTVDTIELGNTAGTAEIVYTAQSQSTLAQRDTIDGMSEGDALDFSGFGLTLTDFDAPALPDGIQLDELVRFEVPVSVDNASTLTDFFAAQVDLNGDGTVGNEDLIFVWQNEQGTENHRIFVDVNQDGNFNQADDMVIDLTNFDLDDNGATVAAAYPAGDTPTSAADIAGEITTDFFIMA